MQDMQEIIVLCGPSGAGKSTLIGRLIKEWGDSCQFSVSHTTRKPRKHEKEGVNYYYVEREVFDNFEFYEKLEFAGNRYGTTKNAIKTIIENKKVPVLDVNIKSIEQLRKHPDLKMTKIFIKPPSLECLWKRLRGRAESSGESLESSKKRYEIAKEEYRILEKEHFEKILINNDLEQTFTSLKEIIKVVIDRVGIFSHQENEVSKAIEQLEIKNESLSSKETKPCSVEPQESKASSVTPQSKESSTNVEVRTNSAKDADGKMSVGDPPQTASKHDGVHCISANEPKNTKCPHNQSQEEEIASGVPSEPEHLTKVIIVQLASIRVKT